MTDEQHPDTPVRPLLGFLTGNVDDVHCAGDLNGPCWQDQERHG